MSHRRAWEAAISAEPDEVDPDALEDGAEEWHRGLKPKPRVHAAEAQPRSKLRGNALVDTIGEDRKYAGAVIPRRLVAHKQGVFKEDSGEEGSAGDSDEVGEDGSEDDDEDVSKGDDDDEDTSGDDDGDEESEGELDDASFVDDGSEDDSAASEYDATEAANPIASSSRFARARRLDAAASAFGADVDAELAALQAADAAALSNLAQSARQDADQGARARNQMVRR
jgi:cobalamin biosynthesis protein CobT